MCVMGDNRRARIVLVSGVGIQDCPARFATHPLALPAGEVRSNASSVVVKSVVVSGMAPE